MGQHHVSFAEKSFDRIEYIDFYSVVTNLTVTIGSRMIQYCDKYCER